MWDMPTLIPASHAKAVARNRWCTPIIHYVDAESAGTVRRHKARVLEFAELLSSGRQRSMEATYYAGIIVADVVDHVNRQPSNVTHYDLV